MTALPAQYAWLSKEGGPKMLIEALKLFGTLEAPGAKDNPVILAWAAELGLSKTYSTTVSHGAGCSWGSLLSGRGR